MAFLSLGMGRAMSASEALRLIKMNTQEPLLTNNRENQVVNRVLISRASRRTPLRPTILVARKKYWQPRFLIFLMPLGPIALMICQLHALPVDILRQAFEGFSAAICAVACGGILLWRVIHSLAIEQSFQTQPSAAKPAPISPSEPNLAEPRKAQSSLPPDAATASVAPVASLPIEIGQ